MKRFVSLLFVLCCLFGSMKAQDYRMVSFEEKNNSMIAREHMVEDENGKQCALICVSTQDISPEIRQGFYFESDWGSYVVQKTLVGPEIWVWVSPGLKTLKVRHSTFGNIDVAVTEHVPKIESLHTYQLVLRGISKSGGYTDPVITQQFLVFTITPKDAVLTVDGTPWQVIDGMASGMVNFGKHEYTVNAKDYHRQTGSVVVKETDDTVMQDVILKPAFGYLKLEGNRAILSKSSIFVDDANASEALDTPIKLSSGQHKLTIVNSKYNLYERRVDIFDEETNTLTVNLDANFSTITLQVDADADIYVNKVRKGTRSWTGDLEAGNYIIECQQKNHRTTSVQKTITNKMSGTTITLEAPKPINGVLIVNTNPPMANVFIDGEEMGKTPKQIRSILIGEHILRLEKEGCAPLIKTISIEEGKTLALAETLETGRSVLVKTDRKGDKIYVDGSYVGETPRETSLGFGHHTIRVERNGVRVEREAVVTETSRNGQEMVFEFGKLITINTDQNGDMIMVDGVNLGVSPLRVDLPFGTHTIRAERGEKFADKTILVQKIEGETSHRLVLHTMSASDYVRRGVSFITLDYAYNFFLQNSFGITFGSVRRVGWYMSVASNYQFDAMNSSNETDYYGLVNGYYPSLVGSPLCSRVSVMGGMVVKLFGPVYFRFGAGYGACITSQQASDGSIVKIKNYSFEGVDATAGLQFNIKGFTFSADAVTTQFQTVEAKVGVGFCWRKNKK